MSHDQRPGKMRVVKDAAPPKTLSPAIAAGANGAVAGGGAGAAAKASAAATPAKGGGISLFGALFFLIACAIGGALFAALNPLGLG